MSRRVPYDGSEGEVRVIERVFTGWCGENVLSWKQVSITHWWHVRTDCAQLVSGLSKFIELRQRSVAQSR